VREKKGYPLDGKTIFGLSTMRWINVAASAMMTSAFMLYLTDYSGIAKAAAVATILLLAGRILDVIDDPLQGWIMDNSKRTRIGKFKPFMLGGIALCAIALIMLFNMPTGVSELVKITFLSLGYILYEVGYSFQPDVPIKISLSPDPRIREKILVVPRIVEQFVAIPFSFFITIALAIGASLGSNHAGWGLTAVILVVPMFIISIIGTWLVKEGPYSEKSGGVKFKDLINMFKNNKALWISQIAGLVSSLVFSFLMVATTYYLKWAYGPQNLGTLSAVWGASILFGFIIGTAIAPKVLKRFIPIWGAIFCNVACITPLVIIYILGLFNTVIPVALFLTLLFLSLIFIGMNYIPGTLVNMEVMDFNKVTGGKAMEGMVQATTNFVLKASTALAGLATGTVLIAIRYDAELYESQAFIDAGGQLPEGLLSGLLMVIGLIPAILGAIAALILLAYPIKGKFRDEMYARLEVIRREENMVR
jgi:Na+/melibiose symporter-like transporter